MNVDWGWDFELDPLEVDWADNFEEDDMFYFWDAWGEPAYITESVFTTACEGHRYTLAVEQDEEGFHALLLEPDETEPTGYALVDEAGFDSMWDAQDWCEKRDKVSHG